ncbi:MAG TPA: DUF2735 domain-containing protein [Pseudolabrys sp.]|nr:DUF2735 domain-containing protein [Pseudolabrys sp.]
MTTDMHRESAKIYTFPARGRFAVGASYQRSAEGRAPAAKTVPTVAGGAWYHDEAIREAERPRKN